MSALSGNEKSNLLVSFLFPKGTCFEGQCALERQIQNTIAKAIKAEYPNVHFVIADEECISDKLNRVDLLTEDSKQIPKKPIETDDKDLWYRCPVCKGDLTHIRGSYCSYCGQKLDWI